MYTFTAPYNWQAGTSPLAVNDCSRTLQQLGAFLKYQYGGQPMGCYGVRPIRGGNAPSSHSWGAAYDWRYENVTQGFKEVGRTQAVAILEWLIEEALNIGIQQIHDYYGGRVWKVGRGWKQQPSSQVTGFGQGWARYFHIEVHPEAWHDDRPITQRTISEPPPPNHTPVTPFDPPTIPGTSMSRTVTVTVPSLEVLRLGAQSRDVTRLQCLLRWCFDQQTVVPDGKFGPVTEAAVKNVQTICKVHVDGVVGAQTWTAILDQ
jgi:hypothetical protein